MNKSNLMQITVKIILYIFFYKVLFFYDFDFNFEIMILRAN